MEITIGEKIRIAIGRQKMSIQDLAAKLGQSRQNLSRKLSSDNFPENEAREIARALGAEYICVFRFPDGSEL